MPMKFQSIARSPVDLALMTSIVVSSALLAGAHIFEALGYQPCGLCLDQREAHWAAAGVAAAGLIASRLVKAGIAATAAVGATAFVYALSAGLAFFHTGVEFSYWPAFGCDASMIGDGMDVGEFAAALDSATPVAECTNAQWRLFDISMAGYNFLASTGLFALCAGAALATTRRLRNDGEAGVHDG